MKIIPSSTPSCVVYQKPLPPGRVDRLTCSGRCRTQRARQASHGRQPSAGLASRAFRQDLRVATPIRFWPRRPTPFPYTSDPQILPIEAGLWDAIFETLNHLYDLHYELGMIASWQGETGHHIDPLTGESEGNDICGALLQHLADSRKLGAQVQAVRGRAGRLLAPAGSELAHQLGALAGPVRQLVAAHQTKETPYEVVIEAPLLAQIRAFQDWVSHWWFVLLDQG